MNNQLELVKQKMPALKGMLANNAEQIAVALPPHMETAMFARCVQTYFLKHPELFQCQPASIARALFSCAQIGLYPDPTLGMAYLVKYGTECTLVPGYRGLIDLMRRAGNVKRVEAQVVIEGDEFDAAYGTSPHIIHKPSDMKTRPEVDDDNLIAAYAIARFADGSHQFEIVDKAELFKIRNTSKAKNGPWRQWFGEMLRKSGVRRLAKYVPLDPRLAAAIEVDTAHMSGEQAQLMPSSPLPLDDGRAIGERIADDLEKTLDADELDYSAFGDLPLDDTPKAE